MKQPEATFKQDLNKAFAEVFPLGWCAYVKGLAKSGVPDLHYQTGMLEGQAGVWVEAKVGANPLRSTQEREIRQMVVAGSQVRVVRLIKDSKAPWRVGIRCVTTALIQREKFCEWKDRATWDFWRAVLLP